MKEASEDEQEDVLMGSNTGKPRTSKSQSERAEQLRRMMEDEGEKASTSKGLDIMIDNACRRRDGGQQG